MKGRAIRYSADELGWLKANRTLPIGDYAAGFTAAFGRADVEAKHLHALRKRKGWLTGRTGRFEKGMVPLNKGRTCAAGEGGRHPNASAHHFKRGQLSGRAAAVIKPIGTERVSKDGYLERKVNNDLPFQRRWRAVHLIRWEEAHGALPAGHALKCLDGDKRNTDPSNWACVPRALLPRLNGRFGRGYDQAPAEVKPVLLAITRLEHRVREARA